MPSLNIIGISTNKGLYHTYKAFHHKKVLIYQLFE